MKKLEGVRIFAVEDDVMNVAVYSRLLRNHGAIVFQDHWQTTTVDLIRRHLPIDVILLDLMLRRGVSGYDIFEQLKTLPGLENTPVVAVSASDPELEIPRAREIGLAGFIPKPIQPQDFADQIAMIIEGHNLWLTSSYELFDHNPGSI